MIDAEGAEHDLQTDRHGPARGRPLALWNRRQDKVDAFAMAEGPVGLWHARALCRRFAREHAGATPQTVILTRRVALIAGPWTEVPADRRERFDSRAKARVVRQVECAMEPHGQWPEDMLGRLGLSAGAAFVPLARNEERWAKVRGRLGPLWPYEEWAGLLAIGGIVVLVTDSEGTVILATEPVWRGLPLTEALAVKDAPSAIARAFQATTEWAWEPLGCLCQGRGGDADRGAGAVPRLEDRDLHRL